MPSVFGLALALGRVGLLVVFALLAVASWLMVVRPKWRYRVVDRLDGPRWVPFVGTVFDMSSSERDGNGLLEYFLRRTVRFGAVYRVWDGPMPVVTLACPHAAREVLQANTAVLGKSILYESLRPWLGDGLLLSKGPAWRARRKLLTHAFHFSILHNAQETFAASARELCDALSRDAARGGAPIDIFPMLQRLTLDTISTAAMSQSVHALRDGNNNYVTAVRELSWLTLKRIMSPWLWPAFLGGALYAQSADGRRARELTAHLHAHTRGVLETRRKNMASAATAGTTTGAAASATEPEPELARTSEPSVGSSRGVPFLDLLLGARDDDGHGLAEQDILSETETFLFEGQDTTAAALAWACHLLGLHPEVQARLAAELARVLGPGAPAPTLAQLGELPYLDQVINEVLRLYPPVPFIQREIDTPLVLESVPALRGAALPAGTTVTVAIFAIHRNPAVWSRPNEFDPDRFAAELPDPFAHIPFSAGSRGCIGRNFAKRELAVVLACLVARFHIVTDPNHDPRPVPELIMRPTRGILVSLAPR